MTVKMLTDDCYTFRSSHGSDSWIWRSGRGVRRVRQQQQRTQNVCCLHFQVFESHFLTFGPHFRQIWAHFLIFLLYSLEIYALYEMKFSSYLSCFICRLHDIDYAFDHGTFLLTPQHVRAPWIAAMPKQIPEPRPGMVRLQIVWLIISDALSDGLMNYNIYILSSRMWIFDSQLIILTVWINYSSAYEIRERWTTRRSHSSNEIIWWQRSCPWDIHIHSLWTILWGGSGVHYSIVTDYSQFTQE